MPKIIYLTYEFSDYDEAKAAIDNYAMSQPPDVLPYPKFEIDWVDIELHDSVTIWLKLKPWGRDVSFEEDVNSVVLHSLEKSN